MGTSLSDAVVTGLFRYPIKGCRAVAADYVDLTPTGVLGDRELAIVDRDGVLFDQVTRPQMARLALEVLDDGQLVLAHPDAGVLEHAPTDDGAPLDVTVTLDRTDVVDQGDPAADWLGRALGEPARLVRVNRPWPKQLPLEQFALVDGKPTDRFTSAAPVLLNNQASLDDLNGRLETPIPMNRFRMNVVVSGLDAFAEDHLVTATGAEVQLQGMTACERCVIITTDQRTGERPSGEPLQALADYRKKARDRYSNGLLFGAYLAVAQPGQLRVGERLSVELDGDAAPLVALGDGS